MSQNPAASDWAAARGEKWCAQLTGMESTLEPVDEPLLRALQLDAPLRIAEVGCGGGGTTIAIARAAPAGSVVHGFDISPVLVARARERAQDERAIAFDVADMAKAAPDKPYDRLVSRFGIMFFDDAPAAFANLARWLKPGGRFAFAVWGAPSDNSWFMAAREIVGRVIDVPPPDPDAPGPYRYANAETLRALLTRAGFTAIDVNDWQGALPIGGRLGPADAAHFALAAFSSFGDLLAKAGEEAQREARRHLTDLFSQRVQDGAVRMNASVHIFTGARP